jgi:hypothetical protein
VTPSRLRALRAATHAAVDAFFTALEAAPAAPRVTARPPAQPDGEYSPLDMARAEAVLRKHGMVR